MGGEKMHVRADVAYRELFVAMFFVFLSGAAVWYLGTSYQRATSELLSRTVVT
jgi:hypothetical protein